METTKQERLDVVNKLITCISERGRRFFYSEENRQIAHMKIKNNRVYFIDDRTGIEVYAYPTYTDRKGFSHGGTLWAMVCEFSLFIRKGGYVNGVLGYGGLYGSGWGHSNEIQQEIIEYAKKIGYLRG